MLLIAQVGVCQLFLLEGDPFVYELFGGGPDARFTSLLTAAEEMGRRTVAPEPEETPVPPRLRSV